MALVEPSWEEHWIGIGSRERRAVVGRRGQHGWRHPWNRKRRVEIASHLHSCHSPTIYQCPPLPSGTEASWWGGPGNEFCRVGTLRLKAQPGGQWIVQASPNFSFLSSPSLPPWVPRPFYHGMLKQCDWVESFAPALSANHSAALTIKYECVTMRA